MFEGSAARPHTHPGIPGLGAEAGEALSRTEVAYLGPRNYDDLRAADTAAGFQTSFEEVVDLGWFAFIGPLLSLLQKFQRVSQPTSRSRSARSSHARVTGQ